MKKIKKYNQFVSENKNNKLAEYSKSQMVILSDIDLSLEDKDMMLQIVEKLYNDLNQKDKSKVDSFLEKREAELSDVINEAFWDKFSKRIDKAAEVSDVLPDESEGVLKKLVKKAGKAMNFVGKLLKSAKEWIAKTMGNVKEKVLNKIKGDNKFSEAVKKVADENENGFVKDLKTSNTVYKFYKKDLLGSFLESIKKGLGKFFSKEQEPIPESFDFESIDEGKNVLSTFVHGIEKVPPFSWLHKVSQLGEKGASEIIEGLSFITDKLGGPKFALPVISVLIGLAFEYNIKGAAKHGILSVLGDAFTGGLLSVISWIATFIAAVIAIDEISGKNIMGGGAH